MSPPRARPSRSTRLRFPLRVQSRPMRFHMTTRFSPLRLTAAYRCGPRNPNGGRISIGRLPVISSMASWHETSSVYELSSGEPQRVAVAVGVIADRMSTFGDRFHERRAGARETSDQEECRGRPVALEHVEDCSSGRRIGPIVESQREDRFGMQSAERWAEQLRSRVTCRPGCGTRQHRGPAGNNRPDSHLFEPGQRNVDETLTSLRLAPLHQNR